MLKGVLWLVGLFVALAFAGSVLVASSYVQWRGTTDQPKGGELYDPSTQRFSAAGAHECTGGGALVNTPSGAVRLRCGESAGSPRRSELEWSPTARAFREVPAPNPEPVSCGEPLQDGRQASVATPQTATDSSVLQVGFRGQCVTLPTPQPMSANVIALLPGERLFISGSTVAWDAEQKSWEAKAPLFAVVELGTRRWVELPAPRDGDSIHIRQAAAASPSQVFVAGCLHVGDEGQEGPWQAWLLDLTTRVWTRAALPAIEPNARRWPATPASSLSGGVLLGLPAGGLLFANKEGNWSYSLATHTWSPVASMLEPRSSPSSLVLPDGRVLFAGGITEVTRPRYDMGGAARFAAMVILPLAMLGLAFYLSRRFQAPIWSRITAVVLSLMWTGLFALVLAGLSGLHGRPARTRSGAGPRRLRQPRARFRAQPNASPRARPHPRPPSPASLREAFRWACDARLELASVTAFEELADALEALHAPSSLVERCHQAAAGTDIRFPHDSTAIEWQKPSILREKPLRRRKVKRAVGEINTITGYPRANLQQQVRLCLGHIP